MMLLCYGCHKCDNCMHGGTCSGNTCSCPDPYSGNNCDTSCTLGFEGYQCQTYSRTRFLGTWNCTSNDPLGNTLSFQMVLASDSLQPVQMAMHNFNNKGYKVICTMTGKYKFDIQPQISTGIHASVSGNGLLRGNALTVYITEDGIAYFGSATLQ